MLVNPAYITVHAGSLRVSNGWGTARLAAGSDTLYRLEVPENGTGPLSFRSYTGSGNVSLYVSHEAVPTTADELSHARW